MEPKQSHLDEDLVLWSDALPTQKIFSFYLMRPHTKLSWKDSDGVLEDYYGNLVKRSRVEEFRTAWFELNASRALDLRVFYDEDTMYVEVPAPSRKDAESSMKSFSDTFYSLAEQYAKSEHALETYGKLQFGFERAFRRIKLNTN